MSQIIASPSEAQLVFIFEDEDEEILAAAAAFTEAALHAAGLPALPCLSMDIDVHDTGMNRSQEVRRPGDCWTKDVVAGLHGTSTDNGDTCQKVSSLVCDSDENHMQHFEELNCLEETFCSAAGVLHEECTATVDVKCTIRRFAFHSGEGNASDGNSCFLLISDRQGSCSGQQDMDQGWLPNLQDLPCARRLLPRRFCPQGWPKTHKLRASVLSQCLLVPPALQVVNWPLLGMLSTASLDPIYNRFNERIFLNDSMPGSQPVTCISSQQTVTHKSLSRPRVARTRPQPCRRHGLHHDVFPQSPNKGVRASETETFCINKPSRALSGILPTRAHVIRNYSSLDDPHLRHYKSFLSSQSRVDYTKSRCLKDDDADLQPDEMSKRATRPKGLQSTAMKEDTALSSRKCLSPQTLPGTALAIDMHNDFKLRPGCSTDTSQIKTSASGLSRAQCFSEVSTSYINLFAVKLPPLGAPAKHVGPRAILRSASVPTLSKTFSTSGSTRGTSNLQTAKAARWRGGNGWVF